MSTPLAQAFVRIRPEGGTFKAEAEREINTVDGKTAGTGVGKKFGGGVAGGLKSTIGAISGVLLAAGILKFGKDSIAAYKQAQDSMVRLQDAFAKFPGLADSNIGAFDTLNQSLQKKTKFDHESNASGESVLAQFHLTGQQILQLTPLLDDYAAKTGQSLPAAAGSLGKALLGQGRALKQVGINFKDTHTVGGNFTELMGGLRTQVGGFANTEGKTASGQLAIMHNQFQDVEEEVGGKLVPALIVGAGWFAAIAGFISKNIGVIGPLVVVLGGLAFGIWAVNAAVDAWAAAQAALDVILTANPIGLIIAAIALLVVGLIIAYKHSQTFRDIVNGAFHAIMAVVGVVVGFITSHWKLLFAILTGPIGLAVLFITSHWGGIVAFFKGIPAKIGAVIGGVTSIMIAPFKAAFNAIAGIWNDTVGKLSFTIPSWVPGLGGKGFSMPKIPTFANGVLDFAGGLARVGERGPETVVLPAGSSVIPHGRSAGGGGPAVHVEKIELIRGDPQQVFTALDFAMRKRGM